MNLRSHYTPPATFLISLEKLVVHCLLRRAATASLLWTICQCCHIPLCMLQRLCLSSVGRMPGRTRSPFFKVKEELEPSATDVGGPTSSIHFVGASAGLTRASGTSATAGGSCSRLSKRKAAAAAGESLQSRAVFTVKCHTVAHEPEVSNRGLLQIVSGDRAIIGSSNTLRVVLPR